VPAQGFHTIFPHTNEFSVQKKLRPMRPWVSKAEGKHHGKIILSRFIKVFITDITDFY
jgi:hypothetical protein